VVKASYLGLAATKGSTQLNKAKLETNIEREKSTVLAADKLADKAVNFCYTPHSL